MAGTSPILTYGFGSYGGIELVPTLGFEIGEADYFLSLSFSLYITTSLSFPLGVSPAKSFNLSLAY